MLCVLVVNLVLLPIAITFVDTGDNGRSYSPPPSSSSTGLEGGENRAGFEGGGGGEGEGVGVQWAVLSSLTDSVFIADLLLNFRTAYFPSKSSKSAFCILDSKLIAKCVLSTSFLYHLNNCKSSTCFT